jgi:hypothetical protein
MLTLVPKGVQTKIIKKYLIENFFYLQPHRQWWCTLSREYLREFSKKIEMAVTVYSGD